MDSALFINSVDRAKRYSALLTKCCSPKDKPPKQKHIRHIVMATYQDQHLEGLLLSLKEIAGLVNSISCWKLYFVIHNVMRDGSYSITNFHVLSTYLKENYPRAAIGDFYGAYGGYYRDYLQNKAIFHQKSINIKGNLSVKNGYQLCPYKNGADGLVHLNNCVKYFEACLWTLETFLNSIHDGRNKSTLDDGKNKLMPIYLLFEDCLGIFKLLPELFLFILDMIDESFENFYDYAEMFNLSYFKLRKLLNLIAGYTFLENLINIPNLGSVSPLDGIIAEARKKKAVLKQSKQSKSVTHKPMKIQSIPDILTVVEVNKPSPPPDLHNECVRKINQLTFTISNYEQNIRDFESKLQSIKESAMHKYNADMNFATEKLKLLQQENNLLRREIDESQKMEQQNTDERFNRLKDMYVELRNEYKKANEEVTKSTSEKNLLKQADDQKNNKISELKTKIEVLNMELMKHESQIASTEFELNNLKTQTSQGKQQSMAQLEEAKREVELIQQKYNTETGNLHNQIVQLQTKLDSHNILNTLIEILKKRFANYKTDLYKPSDNECQPKELVNILGSMQSNVENFFIRSNMELYDVINFISDSSVTLGNMVMIAKGVTNVVLDPILSQNILDYSKTLIDSHHSFINLLNSENSFAGNDNNDHQVKALLHQLKSCINDFMNITQNIPQNTISMNNASPEDEIITTQHTILQAKALLTAVIQQADALSAKQEINVNKGIMSGCTTLIDLVENLIKIAITLQTEIVELNRGSTKNIKEFYKKNHRWAEGLISAAKAVGAASHFLVQTADRTVSEGAPLEELIVASLDISASTAQLISASRVKAEPESKNLQNLVKCAYNINKSSDALVSNVSDIIRNNNADHRIDLSHLSVTQTKRLEMNVQIKCLELESDLERERSKLLHIRSKNFHAASSSIEKLTK